MRGSFPVATAKMARVTAICMSDLIPMIIPPRDLTVYLCGVPLWSARVNAPRLSHRPTATSQEGAHPALQALQTTRKKLTFQDSPKSHARAILLICKITI
jgi:hypothetical protein